ncbi:unnamed protein product [Cuscuta epithymum]|uniref:TOG domain-containing protein n=1 Tax=Cuscuta epithymum TaxID=186058 RepID=A0AAV0FJN1_9ASTE|nr:unnamed protein product [Cuscuta epithymum]
MSSGIKSAKPSKPPNPPTTAPSRSSTSSLSSHLAMVELKQRILTSLSKLSDRDTHQIAVEDLEKIIQTLSHDGVPMFLNCLYDSSNDSKPAVKKESLLLLAALCAAHGDSTATHLTKIIAHIVKRLKDSDSAVREACCDAIGSLSSQYLKGEAESGGGLGSVVSLFVKPLFEAMGENNKTVQGGAAMCMAKMVERASDPPVLAFQKLCPRICKYLNSPNFMAKASLLFVVSSLSQVGAIAPQNFESLLRCLQECISSSEWATRKAAADTLTVLALHSSNLVTREAASVLTLLEASRFDKIKPVRDSMLEALQLWKKIAGKGNGVMQDNDKKTHDGETSESADLSESRELQNHEKHESVVNDSSNKPSPSDSVSKPNGGSISEKTAGILKKKAPSLTDKEWNPEFFQKLETRGSDDLPVEVVVPRRCINASNVQNEEDSVPSDTANERARGNCQPNDRYNSGDRVISGASSRHNGVDLSQREPTSSHAKSVGQSEGFLNNKGNWLAIQRQLLQLERQQSHLMNMLQDFMGGSHDSMVTLESRVCGLERVVDEMAQNLSISAGRRGSNFRTVFEGSPNNRPSVKYNSGFSEYGGGKLVTGNDGRIHFGERFVQSDGMPSGIRGRGLPWRSEATDAWDFHTYGKNVYMGSRRAVASSSYDGRSPKSENETTDQVGSRRAWEKGALPFGFGEGPSARSVWRASKDEATLEAIRVAGDDSGTSRGARVAIPELTAEALGGGNNVQERDPVWTSWRNVMDALAVGDVDSAFADVLSIEDDVLLVKLMEISGPVIDQLSNEVVSEVLHAVAQFLVEQNLFYIGLPWVQQLADIILEHGPGSLNIPDEVKKELVSNLHNISSTVEFPEDCEGPTPDQLLLQLASAWEIDLN